MSDTAPAAPSPVEPVAAPAAPPPVVEPAGDPFETLDMNLDSFPRQTVEGLRRENAKQRTRFKEAEEARQVYEQIYGGYAPEEREVWFDLARRFQTDPAGAANRMREIAEAVEGWAGGAGTGTQAPPATDVDSEDRPLSRKELDAVLAEREAKRQETDAINAVYRQVTDAGFDPDDEKGLRVMWLASKQFDGDVAKAAEHVKAEEQRIIDAYVASKAQAAGIETVAAGGTPSHEKTIKTLKDADAAAKERLRAMGIKVGMNQ